MEIVIALGSIVAITALAAFVNTMKVFPVNVCPICTGVALTWFWILGGMYLDTLEPGRWSLVAAIAMGGSVVGIAYQLERRLPRAGSRGLFWKSLFIPAGFAAAYGVLVGPWWLAAAASAIAAAIVFSFARKKNGMDTAAAASKERSRNVAELEEKMKQCC